jgi:NADH-quinone oxidoreductase subunit N
MFYLSLELASIPVAAMANFDLHKKSIGRCYELIFISAFASAVLLFGISLIYGATGTISFDH